MTTLWRKMIAPWGTARCATAAFLVLWLITPQLRALDFTCTTNNGAITITGYTGPGTVVILPSSINGLPVTSIGEGAFSHCTNLTNLRIPHSVTNVGRGAFQGYSGPIGVYTHITPLESEKSLHSAEVLCTF